MKSSVTAFLNVVVFALLLTYTASLLVLQNNPVPKIMARFTLPIPRDKGADQLRVVPLIKQLLRDKIRGLEW